MFPILLVYVKLVILFLLISREKYIRLRSGVSVWMGRKTCKFNEVCYDKQIVFGSTGFDRKFVAFVDAR